MHIQVPSLSTLYIFKGKIDGVVVEKKYIEDLIDGDRKEYEIEQSIFNIAVSWCDFDIPFHAHDVRNVGGEKYEIEIYDERNLSEVVDTIEVSVLSVLSFKGRYFNVSDLEIEVW